MVIPIQANESYEEYEKRVASEIERSRHISRRMMEIRIKNFKAAAENWIKLKNICCIFCYFKDVFDTELDGYGAHNCTCRRI